MTKDINIFIIKYLLYLVFYDKFFCCWGSSAGTTVVYKSNERKKLKKSGYWIIDTIGDQWSDILGTNTENRTFKLSNPMYYISWWKLWIKSLFYNDFRKYF